MKSFFFNSKFYGRVGDLYYLSEFYNNLRFYYLFIWKFEWREYVSKKSKELISFLGRQVLIKIVDEYVVDLEFRDMDYGGFMIVALVKLERVVMYVDMDCFFVLVGLRKRLDLIGKMIFMLFVMICIYMLVI